MLLSGVLVTSYRGTQWCKLGNLLSNLVEVRRQDCAHCTSAASLTVQFRSAARILEGARFWVTTPKGIQGCHPGKILKNVHAIWCIILHLLHKIINYFLLSFSSFSPSSFFFSGARGGGCGPPGPLTAPLVQSEII